MKYEVSDIVPPPKRISPRHTGGQAIVRSLKPGQSAWFEGVSRTSLWQYVYRIRAERPAAKWTTRREGDGTRIWCLSDPMA